LPEEDGLGGGGGRGRGNFEDVEGQTGAQEHAKIVQNARVGVYLGMGGEEGGKPSMGSGCGKGEGG
jgi:hypothetical protein